MEGSTWSDYLIGYYLKFTFWMFRLVYIKFEAEVLETMTLNQTFKDKCLWKTREIFQILALMTSALAILSLIINAVVSADDLFLSSKCILDGLGFTQLMFRNFVTFNSRQEILKIIQDLKELSNRRTGEDLKYQVKSYFDEYQRFVKIFGFPSCFMAFLLIGALIINFWIFGSINFPFNFWFPFDPYTTSMFSVAALWVVWFTFNFDVYMMGVDCLIYKLISLIAMEFDILKLDISEVDFTSDDNHAKTFETFVERHNKLYEITDRLQKVYGSNFFVYFLLSSAAICLSAFQISQTNLLVEEAISAGAFVLIAMGQMFLLCFYGQKLINSSAAVADGIYNSNWIEIKENSSKRQLMLMIQRTQKDNKLTGLNFTDISLKTFTTVLYSAYSYYTFLRNVNEAN